jgi:hypothetical protein
MALIGWSWTAEQKKAYRTAFSVGRIGDELWMLVALVWTFICVVALRYIQGISYVVGVVVGFVALYGLTWRVLLPWLERSMPPDLRASLPQDRFSGASLPDVPRTYRELARRWRAKSDAGSV